MLALLSIICIYGALASLMNSIFSQRLLPLGPPLIKVTNKEIHFVWIPLIHRILIGLKFFDLEKLTTFISCLRAK